jgi:glycosyltransferase involved in cell wall biosynthesis
VIITSFNEGGDVKATIDSVRANTTDVEVVLVDDGSTDGSCADAGADVVIQHSERVGIA